MQSSSSIVPSATDLVASCMSKPTFRVTQERPLFSNDEFKREYELSETEEEGESENEDKY